MGLTMRERLAVTRELTERYRSGEGSTLFLAALKKLWALSDGLCGKRLKLGQCMICD